jgi:hypothetical protein
VGPQQSATPIEITLILLPIARQSIQACSSSPPAALEQDEVYHPLKQLKWQRKQFNLL